MKDDVPTGTIIINKQGEFLDKVTALDEEDGSAIYSDVTGSLKDVTFEVFALEDVKLTEKVKIIIKKTSWWQPLQRTILVLQRYRDFRWVNTM